MITRDNYEEFFVLYFDNELPVSMRAAVESFVNDNPDLREEWEALLQCRILPDQDHTFHDKSVLLQYEDSLIAYVDGELGEKERKAVDQLTRQNPSAATELQHLLMTVNHPDLAIVFPDKESLYKKEKSRRVILMPWLRVGAAAATLTAVALLLLPRTHRQDIRPIAATEKKMPQPVTPHTPAALYPNKATVAMDSSIAKKSKGENSDLATSATTGSLSPDRIRQSPDRLPQTPYRLLQASNHIPQSSDRLQQSPDRLPQSSNRLPQSSNQLPQSSNRSPQTGTVATIPAPSVVAPDRSPVDTGSRTPPIAVTRHPENTQPAAVVNTVAVNIPKDQSSFATQALLQETQTDGTDDMTADAGPTPGKSKFRGIFRKVSRAFGKTADRDSDGQKEVLISAFQVALK